MKRGHLEQRERISAGFIYYECCMSDGTRIIRFLRYSELKSSNRDGKLYIRELNQQLIGYSLLTIYRTPCSANRAVLRCYCSEWAGPN